MRFYLDNMADKDLLLEYQKRVKQIMEYVVPSGSTVFEDDDTSDDTQMNGTTPDMGGTAPDPAMGGATPDMGGVAPDPSAMGETPADTSIDGATPDMGGAPADSTMGGESVQSPEGFNPQDMGEAPADIAMGDDGESTMQPDDEVIDISDLTDAQEDMSDDIKHVGAKFDKLLKTIGGLEAMLKSNDDKINALTSEFEKRNPTNVEKLGMQAAKSYPFNVKPEDYWRDKTENSNYSLEDDNNGKGDENYAITNADVNDNNWYNIAKSFDDEDSFMYNQTLNNLLHLR